MLWFKENDGPHASVVRRECHHVSHENFCLKVGGGIGSEKLLSKKRLKDAALTVVATIFAIISNTTH